MTDSPMVKRYEVWPIELMEVSEDAPPSESSKDTVTVVSAVDYDALAAELAAKVADYEGQLIPGVTHE